MVLVATVLVTILLMSVFVYSSPSPVTIEPGSFVETVSYVLWRDGSTYYAKNGLTGAVTSGTNASQISASAINSLPASGGVVYYASSEFTIPKKIELKNNTIISGCGWSSLLKTGNNINEETFYIPEYTRNVTIQNIRIDGNRGQQSSGWSGIKIERGYNITIQNCWIENAYSNGISIGKWSQHIRILNNKISDCGDRAIYGYNQPRWVIIENNVILASNQNEGSCDAVEGSYLYQSVISNNIIMRTKKKTGESPYRGHGIYIGYGWHNTIDGNYISYNGMSGVWLTDACHNTISNNICENNTQSGIYVGASSKYNVVTGNTIYGSGDVGLSSPQTSTKANVITNNIIKESGDCGIYVMGNYSIISGNFVSNSGMKGVGGHFDDGITLEDAYNNTVTNNICIDEGGGNQDWGINEYSDCDFNTILACTCQNNVAGGIRTVGSNTHVNHCWNGTTWIS